MWHALSASHLFFLQKFATNMATMTSRGNQFHRELRLEFHFFAKFSFKLNQSCVT